MRELRRLLVIVEPEAADQPGLRRAGRLAAAAGIPLEAYACEWHESARLRGRGAPGLREARLDALRDSLDAVVRAQVPDGVAVETVAELGHPREERILARIRRVQPDLVVRDSHFHSEARRSLFGPADWPLIRRCPVPLLYAKPRPWSSPPRFAAAVDPGHAADATGALDRRLVAAGTTLAALLGGTLRLVHAYLPLEPGFAMPALAGLPGIDPATAARAVEDAERLARERVEALLPPRPDVQPAVDLLSGAAIEVLPDYVVREAVDVLVLGAVARSRLYEAIVGATAERLLERIECDLLVVNAAPGPRRSGQGSRTKPAAKAAARRRRPGATRGPGR